MPDLTPEAVTVRSLVEELAGLMQRGQPGWRDLLDRARAVQATITDHASRCDAELRIANIDHLAAMYAGDPRTALRHLDRCLAIIDDLRSAAPEHELSRLNDHEWGVRLNRCQVWQALGDLDRAQADVDRGLEMAEASLQPDAHRVMTLVSAAAIRVEREDWPGALALYTDLVEQCRRHAPDDLGTALLGLAQCQARTGAWDEASRNADRAEALLSGDVSSLASLHQLRGHIALGRHDMAGAEHHLAAHAAFTDEHAGLLDAHHRAEAVKARAFAAHSRGDLKLACRIYRDEIAAARVARTVAETTPSGAAVADTATMRLIGALTQGSGAVQDLGLSRLPSRFGRRSPSLHAEALAMTDEARGLALAAGRRLLAAALDVQYAKYVAQWHERVTPASAPKVLPALERCLAATVFLHHNSYLGERSEDRRAAAGKYAAEAFDISFALAFRLGLSGIVAELIELRCATGELPGASDPAGPVGLGDLGALGDDNRPDAGPGTADSLGASLTAEVRRGLLLAPPPPLRFTPDRTVLAEAFGAARQYGMGVDERAPLDSW